MESLSHVGVDLGGTTISIAYFREGEVGPYHIDQHELDSYSSPDEWVRSMSSEDPEITAVPWVIGTPSPVEDGTKVAETPNLPSNWSGQAIPEALNQADISFVLENDANLAAIGEAHHGMAQDYAHIVLLTLGTGIGGGIIINNEIYRGGTGAASEIGHMMIEPGGRLCGCGNAGCFEGYGSASGLEMTYEKLSGETLDAETIFSQMEHNPLARDAVIQTGLYIGRGVANLLNILEPELVIFSGGMANSLDQLMPWIKLGRNQNTFANRARDIPLRRGEIDNPAIIGTQSLLGRI